MIVDKFDSESHSEDESNSQQHFVREFFILILPKGAISLRKDLKCL